MSEEENRRPLFKRQPTITKTFTPPYTSIRQSEEEKLRVRNPQVKTTALPEEQLTSSKAKIQEQYAGMTISNLDQLSNQIFSTEQQGQLKLKAAEKAQREQFEKDAAKALKEWEREETNNLDAQIEAELAAQGITKKMLQDNAKLRKMVTDWKRANTVKFKSLLINTEKSTIAENKSKFAAAQKAQRASFKKNIAAYESTAKAGVQSQITTEQNRIKTEQTKIMQGVGWKGNWDELQTYAKEQQSNISTLVARGTVKMTGDRIELVKPTTALSDSDITLLNKIGLNVPNLPKGPHAYLYELGQERFKSNIISPSSLQGKVQTELGSVALGGFLTTIADTYNLLLASWTPLPKAEFRGPTSENFKYYQDITPAQQAVLDIANVGGGALGGYVATLPIGLTVKGATVAASGIAQKIGVTAPSSISKIAAKISSNPKFAQAIVWAPMAGFEIHDVYKQIEAGVPIDRIIAREAKNLASIFGGIEGFKAGYALIPDKKMAQLQRLIKIEQVQTPEGPKWVPTVERKNLPKAWADHLATEIDPITGKEVLVGYITENGVKVPISAEFGSLLGDLVQGKTVGPDAVKGAILKNVTKEQYSWLLQRGLNVQTMTPDEIADLMLKELGWGSPYAGAIDAQRKLLTKGIGVIDVKGTFIPKDGNVIGAATKMYNELLSFGLDDSKASLLTGRLLATDSSTISGVAQSLKLSESQTARLVEIWLENGGASKSGIQVFNMLKGKGLNQKQIELGISAIVSSGGDAKAFAANLSKLDSKTLGAVVDFAKLDSAVASYLSPSKLSMIIEVAVPATAGQIVSGMSAQALTGLAVSISASAAAKVMPSLSTSNLQNLVVNMGGATLSNTMMELKPDQLNAILPNLSSDTWSTITPRLSPASMSEIAPNLTPDQLNRVVPNMTPDQLNAVVPRLSVDQLNYVLTQLDIPPAMILKYLQTGQLGAVEGIPPVLLKKLLDEKAKRLKKEDEKQKTRLFEVTLFYYSASERFHIKSNSFHGAARNALQRRATSSIPIQVIVKVTKENVK